MINEKRKEKGEKKKERRRGKDLYSRPGGALPAVCQLVHITHRHRYLESRKIERREERFIDHDLWPWIGNLRCKIPLILRIWACPLACFLGDGDSQRRPARLLHCLLLNRETTRQVSSSMNIEPTHRKSSLLNIFAFLLRSIVHIMWKGEPARLVCQSIPPHIPSQMISSQRSRQQICAKRSSSTTVVTCAAAQFAASNNNPNLTTR